MFDKLLSLFTPPKVHQPPVLLQNLPSAEKHAATTSCPLPDLSHPAWRYLIENPRVLETHDLALQMMLSWIETHLQTDSSEPNKMNKTKMLHAYFRKNQRILRSEINQLFGVFGGGAT